MKLWYAAVLHAIAEVLLQLVDPFSGLAYTLLYIHFV